jgi:hypothetical protein
VVSHLWNRHSNFRFPRFDALPNKSHDSRHLAATNQRKQFQFPSSCLNRKERAAEVSTKEGSGVEATRMAVHGPRDIQTFKALWVTEFFVADPTEDGCREESVPIGGLSYDRLRLRLTAAK